MDGQTEVMNHTIEQYLHAFVHHQPSAWLRFLPWAEFHYNTSVHSTSGFSPFQIIYGKPPPSILAYISGSSSVEACDSSLSSRDAMLALLKKNLLKAQARMKSYADKHRRQVLFDVGSWVFVKLQPYRQTSLAGSKYCKLSKRFYEPYQVLAKVGPVACKLDLPSY